MGKTIVLKDARCLNHETRYGHPESAKRLESVYEMLSEKKIKDFCKEVEPRMATKEDISYNHSIEYIDTIEKSENKGFISLDPDTNTSDGSWKAARLAVGSVLTGIDMILDGKADNGFALVRPPGHHAERGRAMGFCLFNNIAIGAHYLLNKYNLSRVLIVDWDIHHGNGTQHSFYNSSEVLYFSTHQYPYYPGTGAVDETGEKEGKGFTVNVPLSGGQGDDDYVKIFNEILMPLAEEYKPQFVLISAGYDIYHLDPLGTMKVTPQGFAAMTQILKQIAEKHCNGKFLLALEGGYHVEGLAESVKHTLFALQESSNNYFNNTEFKNVLPSTNNILQKIKNLHAATWSLFN